MKRKMTKTMRDFDRKFDLKTAERLLSYQRRAAKAKRTQKRKEERKKYWSKVRSEIGANPKGESSMKRRRAKKIRFRGHLWTRAKFAKKYGKRKAAKCFAKKRHRKYGRNGIRCRGKGCSGPWLYDKRFMRRAKRRGGPHNIKTSFMKWKKGRWKGYSKHYAKRKARHRPQYVGSISRNGIWQRLKQRFFRTPEKGGEFVWPAHLIKKGKKPKCNIDGVHYYSESKCASVRRKYRKLKAATNRRQRRNGPFPHFTVIKGGGKRRKYRRPKLRIIRGGRRYRPAANCRRR